MDRLRPIHRLVQTYFAGQVLVLCVWWGWLLAYPQWIEVFQPREWPREVLRSFLLPDSVMLVMGSLVVVFAIQRSKAWAGIAVWSVAIAAWYPTLYCIAASVRTGEGWLAAASMVCMAGLSLAMATIYGVGGERAASFRAVEMPFRSAWGWTALQIVIFWGTFLWVLPMAIGELEQRLGGWSVRFAGQEVIAVVLFAFASCLGLSSAMAMNWYGRATPLPTATPAHLVERGPYAWIRNPMACAGIVQGIAVGLGMGSPSVMVYALLGGIVWHVVVRPVEESDMRQRFGPVYDAYRQRVGLWIPRWERSNRASSDSKADSQRSKGG